MQSDWREDDFVFASGMVGADDGQYQVPPDAFTCTCREGFTDGLCGYAFLSEYLVECTGMDSVYSEDKAYTHAIPEVTTYSTGGIAGLTTYRLSVTLTGSAINIYSIFGQVSEPMLVPAAYQVDAPFGQDVGGAFLCSPSRPATALFYRTPHTTTIQLS